MHNLELISSNNQIWACLAQLKQMQKNKSIGKQLWATHYVFNLALPTTIHRFKPTEIDLISIGTYRSFWAELEADNLDN